MKRLLIISLTFWLSVTGAVNAQTIAKATFAGGCFWCMEQPFDELDGVISTTSGYTGGDFPNPTYHEVSRGITGHTEAVQIEYNPKKVSYQKLLEVFWRNIDPTVKNRQFCDVGTQYRSGIFYHNDQQKELAEKTKQDVKKQLKTTIFTEITPAEKFYPAEEYHQNYYIKSALLYKYYRFGCGRDKRLTEIWGKKSSH
ncbi:MAG: peptide-methionine (S)-S-oxide reductase MsrA [Cyanobacterium sp. T60_A2020_053]|nr:peptide-methionine (S)-S-oxide reductase MsrA [Cyanobacterium sp. T60_A2020_053]